LNTRIIFESVLTDAVYQKNIKISRCTSKLQLAKVGACLRHTAEEVISENVEKEVNGKKYKFVVYDCLLCATAM